MAVVIGLWQTSPLEGADETSKGKLHFFVRWCTQLYEWYHLKVFSDKTTWFLPPASNRAIKMVPPSLCTLFLPLKGKWQRAALYEFTEALRVDLQKIVTRYHCLSRQQRVISQSCNFLSTYFFQVYIYCTYLLNFVFPLRIFVILCPEF